MGSSKDSLRLVSLQNKNNSSVFINNADPEDYMKEEPEIIDPSQSSHNALGSKTYQDSYTLSAGRKIRPNTTYMNSKKVAMV